MIAFINSVVAGVGVALIVIALAGDHQVALGLVSGVVSVAILMTAFLAYERWRFGRVEPLSQSV